MQTSARMQVDDTKDDVIEDDSAGDPHDETIKHTPLRTAGKTLIPVVPGAPLLEQEGQVAETSNGVRRDIHLLSDIDQIAECASYRIVAHIMSEKLHNQNMKKSINHVMQGRRPYG